MSSDPIVVQKPAQPQSDLPFWHGTPTNPPPVDVVISPDYNFKPAPGQIPSTPGVNNNPNYGDVKWSPAPITNFYSGGGGGSPAPSSPAPSAPLTPATDMTSANTPVQSIPNIYDTIKINGNPTSVPKGVTADMYNASLAYQSQQEYNRQLYNAGKISGNEYGRRSLENPSLPSQDSTTTSEDYFTWLRKQYSDDASFQKALRNPYTNPIIAQNMMYENTLRSQGLLDMNKINYDLTKISELSRSPSTMGTLILNNPFGLAATTGGDILKGMAKGENIFEIKNDIYNDIQNQRNILAEDQYNFLKTLPKDFGVTKAGTYTGLALIGQRSMQQEARVLPTYGLILGTSILGGIGGEFAGTTNEVIGYGLTGSSIVQTLRNPSAENVGGTFLLGTGMGAAALSKVSDWYPGRNFNEDMGFNQASARDFTLGKNTLTQSLGSGAKMIYDNGKFGVQEPSIKLYDVAKLNSIIYGREVVPTTERNIFGQLARSTMEKEGQMGIPMGALRDMIQASKSTDYDIIARDFTANKILYGGTDISKITGTLGGMTSGFPSLKLETRSNGFFGTENIVFDVTRSRVSTPPDMFPDNSIVVFGTKGKVSLIEDLNGAISAYGTGKGEPIGVINDQSNPISVITGKGNKGFDFSILRNVEEVGKGMTNPKKGLIEFPEVSTGNTISKTSSKPVNVNIITGTTEVPGKTTFVDITEFDEFNVPRSLNNKMFTSPELLPKTMIKSQSRQAQASSQMQSQSQMQKQMQKIEQQSRQETRQINLIGTRGFQDIFQPTSTRQAQTQVQQQIQTPIQDIAHITIPDIVSPGPNPPQNRFFPTNNTGGYERGRKKGKRENIIEGFDVFLKRKQYKKGKKRYASQGFTKLNFQPESYNAALEQGSRASIGGLRRTFIVKPSGSIVNNGPDVNPNDFFGNFRPSRRISGGFIKLKGISSQGSVQEIQEARKRAKKEKKLQRAAQKLFAF